MREKKMSDSGQILYRPKSKPKPRLSMPLSRAMMNIMGVMMMMIIVLSSVSISTASEESETCQCGVFLLGSSPLVYSSDAKPVLSGLPVAANCSTKDDRTSCSTICRQLIQAMSDSPANSPLVQTVVLAATRTLACQRFNESHKVPLPRTFLGPPHETVVKLDETRKIWKFLIGPPGGGASMARSDLEAETENHPHPTASDLGIHNENEEETSLLGKLSEPKWLGGFYRWCDEHWVYAGVSLEEPLCCLKHLPRKCPTVRREPEPDYSNNKNGESSRNGRRPRLIIKRRPDEDTSSEEADLQHVDPSSGESEVSSKPPPTTLASTDSTETDTPEGLDNGTSTETLNPFETTARPLRPKKPLNSTVVAEAFKFVGSLMETLGYEQFVHGFSSVLPPSTASDLLERVDVGGWVSNYQDRYMAWPREFSMGYCYVEYSVYNMAGDGILATTTNFLSRVFKPNPPAPIQNTNPNPNRSNIQLASGSQSQSDINSGNHQSQSSGFNNQNNVNNYIPPMSPMSDGGFAYGHPQGIPGNRRVRRDVTVSRAYSAVGGNSAPSRRVTTAIISKVAAPIPQAYSHSQSQSHYQYQPQSQTHSQSRPASARTRSRNSSRARTRTAAALAAATAPPSSTTLRITTTPAPTVSPITTALPPTMSAPLRVLTTQSFLPSTYQYQPHLQSQSHQSQVSQSQYNPQYYQYYNNVPSQGTPENRNLAEFARPRRHNEQYVSLPQPSQSYQQQQPQLQKRQFQVSPQPQEQDSQQQSSKNPSKSRGKTGKSTGKDGGGAASLMNIANLLMQTAMAGNGGGSQGDAVSAIIQNALPLVSQVATSPMIQNTVSNLVTSFLTPPRPPPHHNHDNGNNNHNNHNSGSSSSNNNNHHHRPSPTKNPPKHDISNEIEEEEVSSSNNRPQESGPPSLFGGSGGGGGGGGGGALTSMLGQIMQTYIKHLFSNPEPTNRPSSGSGSKRPVHDKKDEVKPGETTTTPTTGSDIVDMISEVAKPFFISYFGVVPGEPGFGKLKISDRRDRLRFNNKDSSGYSTEILTNDPDPGTGLTDVFWGSVNLPETGNTVYDFGNRVVYAFSRANDPTQGLYCFKQYSVNKMWDYFRVGVRTLFKK